MAPDGLNEVVVNIWGVITGAVFGLSVGFDRFTFVLKFGTLRVGGG